MSYSPINKNSRPIRLHKARVNPEFNSKTVLVDDIWEYIEMWLKRNSTKKAQFYWSQTKDFYNATQILNKNSAPLTAYYCFLNAVKTLFEVKNINAVDRHGVTGYSTGNYSSLQNESIIFQTGGILPQLCNFLGEPINRDIYNLKDILYNLSYLHRAYCLTYTNQAELYIPISNPIFVRKNQSSESWLIFEISDYKYQNGHTVNKLPNGFEKDNGQPNKWIYRKRNRFRWKTQGPQRSGNINRLVNYHKSCRKSLHYIAGDKTLWYFKRDTPNNVINRCNLTLTFAAMHKLSELARYNPVRLAKHFESQHNWLLSEFINISTYQFMDGIASEITGRTFLKPGRRKK
ncbi:YaaC family protein [Tenacibaculum maritimum]|uniref:YaaC family protein n=1 Tax=Flavobacteriaceae TaxID=49546 RepID=UPI00158AAA2E|nr:YaaC family protein [Aquimarina sp. TRL1]QKX04111.1 hypothetical protein HN014_04045 [Aquimarina sp. TRL1]